MPIIKEEPHLGFSCKFYDNGVAKVGTTAAARFSMKVKPDVDFDVQLYIELVKQKAKGRAIEVPEVPPELVAAAAAAADKAASEKAAEAAAREAATRERAAAAAAAKAAEPTLQETVLKAVRAKMQEVQEETKEQLKREIGPLREWLEQQGSSISIFTSYPVTGPLQCDWGISAWYGGSRRSRSWRDAVEDVVSLTSALRASCH